jgi:hypothetical protein
LTAPDTDATSAGVPGGPLDPEAIRALVVWRARVCAESCNSYHRNHVGGQIRGLVWALLGRDPGALVDCRELFAACGVPFTSHGEQVEVHEEWLVAHGLDPETWCPVRRAGAPTTPAPA